jgi:hypothetical protein
LWDGSSGVTVNYFNVGALLPWANKGGDWSDALGVAQGSTAFSSGGSGAVGPFKIDVTALTQWLRAHSSYGMFLKGSGGGVVATRINPDPTKQPTLTVIDTQGVSTVCACTASAVINPSTSLSITGVEFSVGGGNVLLLEFDLDTVANPIAKATLTLTMTHAYSSPLKLEAFATRSAKLFGGGTPTLGIAAKYTRDAGILADPEVYFASSFDLTGDIQNYFAQPSVPVVMAADTVYALDADLGVPALSMKYHIGEFSPWTSGAGADHKWSNKGRVGLSSNPSNGLLVRDPTPYVDALTLDHPQTPSELYFRYYLKLLPGYQCSVEGKKLPGLAGRYGIWTGNDSFGYYSGTYGGNGGNKTTGDWDGTGLSGWSMRHHAYSAPTDANPCVNLVPLNYYAYYVGMPDFFGDFWRWGNPTVGYTLLEQGRWYCIEHYVKVNDIVGPFDALGNGTAVKNGVVRGWLDGVLAFEKTDAVLRKHPAIKIDEVWLDHYHGGTIPAEHEHGLQMAALVVARGYIGPMPSGAVGTGQTGATPAWLNGVPLNQWCAIPGTELIASTDLSAQIAAGLTNATFENIGFGNPRRGIMDYSGGTLKSNGSQMLIFGGGGAGAWAGNDVRALRLEDDAPQWHTVVNPAPATAVWAKAASAPTAYMKDGTPNARHSYWQPQFIDSTDTFMTFGCANEWQMDMIETNDVNSVALGGAWDPAGTHPSIPAARGYDGSWVCKHPVTGQIYAATNFSILRFDANTWQIQASHGGTSGVDRGVGAIDPAHNVLLRIGSAKNDTVHNAPTTINLGTGVWTDAVFSGPFASWIMGYYGAGFVYDSRLGKFLLFQDDGFIYTITYVSDSEWSVDRLALSGTPPIVRASGIHSGGPCAVWGRMQYVSNLGGVCIIQAYDQPAYFVRTALT